MKFLSRCLVALSIFTALIVASPLARRSTNGLSRRSTNGLSRRSPTKSASGSAAGSRSPSPVGHEGTDHVFLVWYQPLGQSARHWSIFVTASAAVKDATGTIYQVVDDRFAPANFKPEMLKGKVASSAGRYEGSASLGQLNAKFMESHYSNYATIVRDLIADHNKDPANTLKLSNCQHWATDMIHVLVDEGVLPATAKTAIKNAPK